MSPSVVWSVAFIGLESFCRIYIGCPASSCRADALRSGSAFALPAALADAKLRRFRLLTKRNAVCGWEGMGAECFLFVLRKVWFFALKLAENGL